MNLAVPKMNVTTPSSLSYSPRADQQPNENFVRKNGISYGRLEAGAVLEKNPLLCGTLSSWTMLGFPTLALDISLERGPRQWLGVYLIRPEAYSWTPRLRVEK